MTSAACRDGVGPSTPEAIPPPPPAPPPSPPVLGWTVRPVASIAKRGKSASPSVWAVLPIFSAELSAPPPRPESGGKPVESQIKFFRPGQLREAIGNYSHGVHGVRVHFARLHLRARKAYRDVLLSANERVLKRVRIAGEVLHQIEIVGGENVQRHAILRLHLTDELFDLQEHGSRRHISGDICHRSFSDMHPNSERCMRQSRSL